MKWILLIIAFIFIGCGNTCDKKGFKGRVYSTGYGTRCSNGEKLSEECIKIEFGQVCGEFIYERYE